MATAEELLAASEDRLSGRSTPPQSVAESLLGESERRLSGAFTKEKISLPSGKVLYPDIVKGREQFHEPEFSPFQETIRDIANTATAIASERILLGGPEASAKRATGRGLGERVVSPQERSFGSDIQDIAFEAGVRLPVEAANIYLAAQAAGALGLTALAGAAAGKVLPKVVQPLTRPIATALSTGAQAGAKAIPTGFLFGAAEEGAQAFGKGAGPAEVAGRALEGGALNALIFGTADMAFAALGAGLATRQVKKVRELLQESRGEMFDTPEEIFNFYRDAGASKAQATMATQKLIDLRRSGAQRGLKELFELQRPSAEAVESPRQLSASPQPAESPIQAGRAFESRPDIPAEVQQRSPLDISPTPRPELTTSELSQGVRMAPDSELQSLLRVSEDRLAGRSPSRVTVTDLTERATAEQKARIRRMLPQEADITPERSVSFGQRGESIPGTFEERMVGGAAQLPESVVPRATSPNLTEGVPFRGQGAAERADLAVTQFQERVRSQAKSLSQELDTLPSAERKSAEKTIAALERKGFVLGDVSGSEFKQMVAQDRAAIRAESESGRIFKDRDAAVLDKAEQFRKLSVQPEPSLQEPDLFRSVGAAGRRDLDEETAAALEKFAVSLTKDPVLTADSLHGSLLKAGMERGLADKVVDSLLKKTAIKKPTEVSDSLEKIGESFDEILPGMREVKPEGVARSPTETMSQVQAIAGSPSVMGRRFPFARDLYRSASKAIRHTQEAGFRLDEMFGKVKNTRLNRIRGTALTPKEQEQILSTKLSEEERGLRFTDEELKGLSERGKGVLGDLHNVLEDLGRRSASLGFKVRDILTYHPRVWIGPFRLMDKSGKLLGTEGASTWKQAETLASNYLKENPGVKSVFIDSKPEFPSAVLDLMGKDAFEKYAAAVKNMFPDVEFTREILKSSVLRGRFNPNLLPRTVNLQGFVKDPIDAVLIYAHGLERKFALDQFNREALPIIDMIPAKRMKAMADWANGYVLAMNGKTTKLDDLTEDTLERVFGMAPQETRRAISLLHQGIAVGKMGLKPLTASVNFVSGMINTNAALGSKWTALGAKDALALKFGNVPESTRKFLSEIGVHFPSQLKTFGGVGGLETSYKKVPGIHPMWMFNKAEVGTRLVAGFAAKREAEAAGKSAAEVAQYARDVITRTQKDYTLADASTLLRGRSENLLFQFKKWPMKELEFIAGMNGKELARYLSGYVALAGAAGIPGYGIAKKLPVVGPYLQEREVRYPKLSKGVPGLLGFDVSGRAGTENIFPDETTDLFGPIIRDFLVSPIVTFFDPSRENVIRMIRGLTPGIVNDVKTAAEQLDSGVATNTTGDRIGKVSKGEAVGRAVGAIPVRLAQKQDEIALEAAENKVRARARSRAVQSVLDGKGLSKDQAVLFSDGNDLKRAILNEFLAKHVDANMRSVRRQGKTLRPETLMRMKESGQLEQRE